MAKTSARLLALLTLLQARRDWPAALLAERLAVSTRTVRRDIERLRELDYPISAAKGPDGGYRLGAGARLPPLLFDDEQAVALAVALRTASTSGADIEEAAARALQTVRQVMPAHLRRRIDTLPVAEAAPSTAARADADVLLALSTAVHAAEVVRFDYPSAAQPLADDPAPPPPRRVEPHHLVTRGGRWYLVAWDLDRADWRVFRVDRIGAPRVPTGPRFVARRLPGTDVGRFLTGRFRGADPSDDADAAKLVSPDPSTDWPCRGTAVLRRPAAEVAPFVRDGLVEDLGPDCCRLTLGSWSWVGLAAALGGFDAEIEAVEPGELADAFGIVAHRYARAGGTSLTPPQLAP